jgi:hypothetical protein
VTSGNDAPAPSPYARLDVLRLLALLPDRLPEIGSADIHLFGYLGCVLACYQRTPPNEWGYPFRATELGAPFSEDIELAISRLNDDFAIEVSSEGAIQATETGIAEAARYRQLGHFPERAVFLEAAVNTLLAMPIGDVRRGALQTDPGFRSSLVLRATRSLLDEVAVDALERQFEVVREASGQDTPVFAPTVAWLSFLAGSGEANGG